MRSYVGWQSFVDHNYAIVQEMQSPALQKGQEATE